MPTTTKMMRIEIAYAKAQEQVIVSLEIEEGSTAETAIRQSGLLRRFPEIDLKKNKVGIFGKVCKLEQTLREGDRVEIYRPLIADPKEARRARAARH